MSASKEYKAVRNCILNELHLTKEDIIKNIEPLLEKLVKQCMNNTYGNNNQIEHWIRCMVNDELKQRDSDFVRRICKEVIKDHVLNELNIIVSSKKDIGIGFRTIEGATEVANLLIKYNAFKMESKFLIGSYEQFWIINGSVCPAITGEAGYSKEEFDKVNKENKDPELESINSFNDTVKKANEIKDRVLKYVYNIKQERSYNNDLVGIFERYKDIADGDLEVAMKFIKEAYPFNEETESFIRKKFDMPIPEESKE